jgi:hypothetical protein
MRPTLFQFKCLQATGLPERNRSTDEVEVWSV